MQQIVKNKKESDIIDNFSLLSLPQHVKDFSTRFYSYKDIWYRHKLKVCFFPVGKIDLRFPNRFYQIRIIKIQRFRKVRVF